MLDAAMHGTHRAVTLILVHLLYYCTTPCVSYTVLAAFCIYELEEAELETLPTQFPGGEQFAFSGDQYEKELVITFPEPRVFTSIVAETTEGELIVIKGYNANGELVAEEEVESGFKGDDAPVETVLESPMEDVVKLVLSSDYGLAHGYLSYIRIEACLHPSTCIYQLTKDDIDELPAVFSGGEEFANEDDEVQITFEEPRTLTSITVETSEGEDIVIKTYDQDGTLLDETTVPSGYEDTGPQPTEISLTGVSMIVLSSDYGLRPGYLYYLEIEACKEVLSTTVQGTTPTPGNWSPWTPWSDCDAVCGNGTITRTRTCSDPPPANGGMGCVGSATENENCEAASCTTGTGAAGTTSNPVDCIYRISQNDEGTKQFEDGEATTDENGKTVFEFDEPKEPKEVIVYSEKPVTLIISNPDFPDNTVTSSVEPFEDVTIPLSQLPEGKVFEVVPSDDTPVTDEDIVFVEINSCVEEEECAYTVHGSDFAAMSTVMALDGTETENTPSGELIFTFTEPIDFTAISAAFTTAKKIRVMRYDEGGVLIGGAPMFVQTTDQVSETPVTTFVDTPTARLVIAGLTTRLVPDEIIVVTVKGCAHGTTPAATTAGAETTSPGECSPEPWSEWSDCSKSCGLGSQSRTRAVEGEHCDQQTPVTDEVRDCNPDACKVDCVWSEWSDWSDCSVTCNGGLRTRSRSEGEPARNGGEECDGPHTESEGCGCEQCGPECDGGKEPHDCANECPLVCAHLSDEGHSCVEDEECIPGCRCPADMIELDGECVHRNSCLCIDVDGNEHLHGEEWTDEENCLQCKCEDGVHCEPLEDCTTECTWSEWTYWGECSVECGGGVQHRYRTPSSDYDQAAANCDGERNETQECNTNRCTTLSTTPMVEETGATTVPPAGCELTNVVRTLSGPDNCIARDVDLTVCSGSCPSKQEVDEVYPFLMASNCACCTGTIETKTVEFECQDLDAIEIRELDVPYHTSCGCQKCEMGGGK